jgi:hypothetical protein
MFAVALVGGLTFVASTGLASASRMGEHDGFNHRGDVLIADQFNNRIIELNAAHHIVWSFGDGSAIPGPHSVVGPNDAERIGELTLISGTGVPAASPPFEPSCASGCPDNRVMLVNEHGRIIWKYGKAGVTGSGFNELNTPVAATALPNGDVLITDQGNQRVIEVNSEHQIVLQYGMTGVTGSGFNKLNNPNSAELLPNGHWLIADENNNRVIEVNPWTKKIVWSYGKSSDSATLNAAAFASRLSNGDTLITDANNNRIVEVNHHKVVVWTFVTNIRPGSVTDPLPTRAVRLRNGNTLISDQFNDQVIAVNHAGNIVYSEGVIGVAGNGPGMLNGPYDAKVVGDYTGITDPGDFAEHFDD